MWVMIYLEKYIDDFKRGVTELLVLHMLYKSDKYGYEITHAFEEMSKGRYTMAEGTLYPILYKLEDAGYISSYSVKVGVRRLRKFYHIEQTGQERYTAMLRDYLMISHVIRYILGLEESENG